MVEHWDIFIAVLTRAGTSGCIGGVWIYEASVGCRLAHTWLTTLIAGCHRLK